MQTYPLALVAGGAATTVQVEADLFVYESGTATPANGDARIAVKSDNGAEIVLRPGQRFRTPERATRWTISAYDKTSAIAGFIIIGSGEFDDANTKNVFTLDATFANTVKVTNTPAEAVPVALPAAAEIKINNTAASRVPVTLDPAQVLNIAGSTVQYTHSFVDISTSAQAATQIFSAAQNPNGAFLELVELSITGSGAPGWTAVSLIAKATPPGSSTDGDVLFLANSSDSQPNQVSPATNITQSIRIKIPAGKGLYLNQHLPGTSASSCRKTVLYTLL